MTQLSIVCIFSGALIAFFLMAWSLTLWGKVPLRLWVAVLGTVGMSLVVFGIELPGSENFGLELQDHPTGIAFAFAVTILAGCFVGMKMRHMLAKLERTGEKPKTVRGLTLVKPD